MDVRAVRSRLRWRSTALCCAGALVCGYLVDAMAQDRGQERATDLTDRVRQVVLTSEPVTVTLQARAEFSSVFEAARRGEGVVALAVEGIAGTTSQPLRINVFVNKVDVTRATSVDDPHFLGFLYLIPRRGAVQPTGRGFDLTPVGPIDPARLTVTLVPIAGKSAAPADAALTVGQIYVRRET